MVTYGDDRKDPPELLWFPSTDQVLCVCEIWRDVLVSRCQTCPTSNNLGLNYIWKCKYICKCVPEWNRSMSEAGKSITSDFTFQKLPMDWCRSFCFSVLQTFNMFPPCDKIISGGTWFANLHLQCNSMYLEMTRNGISRQSFRFLATHYVLSHSFLYLHFCSSIVIVVLLSTISTFLLKILFSFPCVPKNCRVGMY